MQNLRFKAAISLLAFAYAIVIFEPADARLNAGAGMSCGACVSYDMYTTDFFVHFVKFCVCHVVLPLNTPGWQRRKVVVSSCNFRSKHTLVD